MIELNSHQKNLLNCIDLEMREQEERYKAGPDSSLKRLKSIGVALHPINVSRKSFGYADYPEITFTLPFSCDTSSFKDNSPIECFLEGEDSVKGTLIGTDGKKGKFRLFAPDFPDWIEDKGVGIKLAPDHHTNESMKKTIKNIGEHRHIYKLFNDVHDGVAFSSDTQPQDVLFRNEKLNTSQKNAASAMLEGEGMLILHGPPGTGKTTTLIEGIGQQVNLGKRILVSAPSNAAVDNIAKGLIQSGVKVLRVGNTLKIDDLIYPFTSEGQLKNSKEQKELKRLKIQAEEYRKMAMQYKRKFGKEEREQRSLLMREVKRIRKEIRALRNYFDSKLFEGADVVLGTPIGLNNFLEEDAEFDMLVIDEAGQALEPLAWLLFPYAKSWVLAGDPFQLPPTVLSGEAERLGFNISILERCFNSCQNVYFLDTQYRMKESIAGFSNAQFYEGKLKTPEAQQSEEGCVFFFDTAGTGFEENSGKDGVSLINEGELSVIKGLIDQEQLSISEVAFISPYAGQVQLAKEELAKELRVSTIDSFQGQESKHVIISLVRSNEEANIGFLKDYRRMNVALTRAKSKLYVIGDSATIGQDKFYADFLEYVETINGYRSAWELMG